MAKFFLFLLILFVLKATLSQEIRNWVRIDCGSQMNHNDENGPVWQTDDGFIKTGENKWISPNSKTVLDQLKTLRVFKEQNKNCYNLPAPTIDRYLIRAMFHYGNYDGLNNPPIFDLEFGGNKWISVETSSTDTIFHELMYISKGSNVSVCLARTQDFQFPFISMLEIWAIPNDSYAIMSKDVAWIKAYRYNYGGTDLILGSPDDRLNRIWKPMTPSGLDAVKANFTTLDYTTVNEPPDKAIIQAVQAPFTTESIILPFTFNKMNRFDHVEVYFTEIAEDATRKFDLYVNDLLEFTITPQYKNCTGYMINTQSFGPLNVALVPTFDSTLPPIISAIEVYTASDSLVTVGTSQDDLDGLAVLINSFEQLKGWSGEPCLPSDTVWQWLGCTDNNPPRVTSINLTGYGLNGPLPEFSKMQALETINLANNSLYGSIPDFLGKLPSLTLLDLRDNDFSGDIPRSIADNSKLTYYIDGNQNLHQAKKKNLALIVGLAVGIPICILIVIAVIIILYFSKRKRPESSQGQATEIMEMGGTTQEENASVTISTQALVKPSHEIGQSNGASVVVSSNGIHANEQSEETENGEEDVSVNVDDAGITNCPPGIHDIDDEELRDLLLQHGSTGANPTT